MEDNPYSAFWNVVRADSAERASPSWLLGKVITVQPLVVQCGGQNLSGSDLLCNIQLLKHDRDLKQRNITGELIEPPPIGVVDGTLDSTATHDHLLESGDQVAMLMSGDGQHFVVLCKVVAV